MLLIPVNLDQTSSQQVGGLQTVQSIVLKNLKIKKDSSDDNESAGLRYVPTSVCLSV